MGEILEYARSRNVTKIILGKPARARWREWLFGSVVNEMAREGGDIDLYIINGVGSDFASRRVTETKERLPWRDIGWATGVVALCTLVNWPLVHYLDRVNLAMIYLLGIMWTAYRLGRYPALAASFLGVLAFDFFFVPPYFTFAVADTEYILTFAVMLTVGLMISTLAGRLSLQTEALQRRVRRTRMLYKFSRMLSETPDPKALVQAAWKHLSDFYQLPILLFVQEGKGELHVVAGDAAIFGVTHETMGATEWVMHKGEAAGTGTDTLASLGGALFAAQGPTASRRRLGDQAAGPVVFSRPRTVSAARNPGGGNRRGAREHAALRSGRTKPGGN